MPTAHRATLKKLAIKNLAKPNQIPIQIFPLEGHSTLVVLLIYNRIENLRLWLHAWSKCLKPDTKLAVIHNYDGRYPAPDFKKICSSYQVDFYIPRRNSGYDIGAIQDVANNDLPLLTDWNLLHWCVDDTIPMRRDFIPAFKNCMLNTAASPPVGICGIHKSAEYQMHLRTNSFMIRRDVLERLEFPGTKIATKNDCYEFEHRRYNMLYQVESMGLQVRQIDRDINKYFWDSEHLSRYDLMPKFYKEFGHVDITA